MSSILYAVVTELKKQYPHIKKINCNAPHETTITSTEERQRFEQIYSRLTSSEVHLQEYEGAVNFQKFANATKDAYIMRNQDMIDHSDVCVFYYNKDYLPPRRKQSSRNIVDYQPQSGTAIALTYAKCKKKRIINIFN